ncbi:MAG TPA: TilS substrate-binding domain-containing protein, partial [Streptosporangiaceae bacterium]
YLRPLLGVSRAQTTAACAALGLRPWDDPHNSDPAYTRARIRHQLLPALAEALGPGVTAALARTAAALRADADYLDELAAARLRQLAGPGPALSAEAVAALPAALRTRVLRMAAIEAGCPAGSLTSRHVTALDELVTRWHGQRWTDLPGGIRGIRGCGKLTFTAAAPDSGARGQEDPGGRE